MKKIKEYAAFVTGVLAAVIAGNIFWMFTKMFIEEVFFCSMMTGLFAFAIAAFVLDVDADEERRCVKDK